MDPSSVYTQDLIVFPNKYLPVWKKICSVKPMIEYTYDLIYYSQLLMTSNQLWYMNPCMVFDISMFELPFDSLKW